MNALIIRTGALGDTILALIAAGWMESLGWRTDIMGYERYADVVGMFGFGFIAEEISGFGSLYSNPTPAISGLLGRYDLVVAIKSDPDGSLVRTLQEESGGKTFMISPLPPPDRKIGYSCYLAREISKRVGVVPPDRLPLLESRLTLAHGVKRVDGTKRGLVIHPGSGSPGKNWPVSRFVDLINSVATTATFITGPAQTAEELDNISALAKENNISLEHNLTYSQLAEKLANAELYIGVDSGVTHLAAAMGVPVVALFGPTDPEIWRPAGSMVTVITTLGGDMETLDVEQVLETIGDNCIKLR